MIPSAICIGPAEVPLLDWSGPSFLMFYCLALSAAMLWSWARMRSLRKRHEVPGGPVVPEDPYTVAFLSGGGIRVAQMAVSRLILMGLAVWKSGWTGPRLIRVEGAVPGSLNSAEQRLWHLLDQAGKKGLAVKLITKSLEVHFAPLQARLAVLGLRPTDSERRDAAWKAVRPMLFLMVLGILKVLIGLARDKPVLFLTGLLVVTIFAMVTMMSSARRLTVHGQKVLDRLRGSYPARARLAKGQSLRDAQIVTGVSMSLALFGPEALADLPGFRGVTRDMERQMGQTGGADSGGSGCSSGGSSSGDDGGSGCGGGGGCGGCGS